MSKPYDIIIVGGGIVGLATALQIHAKQSSRKILILEKESAVAQHQTSHNSGVIHSGIYYKPGSLKAKNCVSGYQKMVQFCRENEIKHEICGKIIVATSDQEIPQLNKLLERGRANGLDGLKELSAGELKEIEPHVNGIQGIFVPQIGIVDFGEVANAMKNILLNGGVEIRCGEKVIGIHKENNGTLVQTRQSQYFCKVIVSCAGLHSDRIARLTQKDLRLRIIPFRGEYYKIKTEKKYLVKNLIYPVPDPSFPFLGVHFTRMIHGDVEAGPNAVFAFAREGYTRSSFNVKDIFESVAWPGFRSIARKYWRMGAGEFYRSLNKTAFTKALQKLVPEITEDDLVAGGSGVRAQACDYEGNLLDDFYILEETSTIHVCNAPSPAATSSLSIGEYISERVFGHV